MLPPRRLAGPLFTARSVLPPWYRSLGTFSKTMPPGYKATVGVLDTFTLPSVVTGSAADIALGKSIIKSWRRDGIVQISMDQSQRSVLRDAFAASKSFFRLDDKSKAACVDDQSFAGYIASGDEITDGVADYSEIFTVTKDLPPTDSRVQARWPCHGPCPWPSSIDMRTPMSSYVSSLGLAGDTILKLVSAGLGVDVNTLSNITHDGWHHLRVLRFPPLHGVNGKGKPGRGIGSHTDYGLLVIAAQDHVGGLFVRPPRENEAVSNWHDNSSAGKYEDDDGWVYVPPVDGVFTVFPGDMMQFLTSSYLPSTPHKVGLNTAERFAFAYFHEPNFRTVVRPLQSFIRDDVNFTVREGESKGNDHTVPAETVSSITATTTCDDNTQKNKNNVNNNSSSINNTISNKNIEFIGDETGQQQKGVHYGTHFTNMFMRNYPDRITTDRIRREGRMSILNDPALRL